MPLSIEASDAILTHIFQGKISTDEIVTLLKEIQERGETVDEIVGFAQAMRRHMVTVPLSTPTLDLCGTGGSGKDRFNTSTAASFLVASLGIPVAKHGNKGSKKSNGSFDFLESLEIEIEADPTRIGFVFEETRLAFLFARNHHPAVSKVAAARKSIEGRTIFNLLGPLCNPASVTHQVIGTTNQEIGKKIARAIQILGTTKTIVVVNETLDELSTQSKSFLYHVSPEEINIEIFDPVSLNLNQTDIQQPCSSEESAALFLELIQSKDDNHPISEIMALNAGLALYCFEHVRSIKEGFEISKNQIKTGALQEFFIRYKAINKRSV